jgi:hypothetical protein
LLEGWCGNTTNQRILVTKEDGSQEVQEVQNDLYSKQYKNKINSSSASAKKLNNQNFARLDFTQGNENDLKRATSAKKPISLTSMTRNNSNLTSTQYSSNQPADDGDNIPSTSRSARNRTAVSHLFRHPPNPQTTRFTDPQAYQEYLERNGIEEDAMKSSVRSSARVLDTNSARRCRSDIVDMSVQTRQLANNAHNDSFSRHINSARVLY